MSNNFYIIIKFVNINPVINNSNHDNSNQENIQYRNSKGCKREINLQLALLLFTYPKEITKTISLNYNLNKDSYYLREDKKCINFLINKTKKQILYIYE